MRESEPFCSDPSYGRPFRGKLCCGGLSWTFVVSLLMATCFTATLVQGTPARAAGPARIQSVDVGFEGVFKVGCWSPIRATVSGPPGTVVQLRIITPDPDGNPCVMPLDPVTLTASTMPILGVFRSGLLGGAVRLELRVDEKLVDQKIISVESGLIEPLTYDDQIWLLAGDHPAFQIAADRWNRSNDSAVVIAELGTTPGLTASPLALESVDAVVVGSGQPVSRSVSEQLRVWTSRGGHLVVTVGEESDELRGSPLATWLPVVPDGSEELRELGNLKELIPGSSTLRVRGSIPAGHLSPSPSDGLVLARSLSGPLIVRSAYGVGEVTVLAVDLARRPLSTWDEPAQADLAVLLANLPAPWKEGAGGSRSRMSSELNPTGVGDLQTQLINTLDHYENVPRPTQWTVLGWIAILLLLLGPVDYFLVHKLLRRPHWTWITLPCWVVLVSLWSLSAGAHINRAPLTTRQVDLVDLDQTLGTLRARSWLSFYSPSTRRYRVSAAPAWEQARESEPVAGFLGWVERPESGFRGMYRTGGADLGKPSYEVYSAASDAVINNFPARVWSSGMLEGNWERASEQVAELVHSELRFEGARLRGVLMHELPGELQDWFIAYDSFAYFPKRAGKDNPVGTSLPPDTRFDLKSARSNLLRGVLIGLTQTVVAGEDKRGRAGVERENYDPLSRDPFRLARVLTFHQATGGTDYTGLANGPLADADLSHLLPLNRAILFGRVSVPATEFTLDEVSPPAEQRDTFVRIILPVDRQPRDPDAPPPEDLLRSRE